jgi:transglutaminase-like putative cysteine protease/tetratricopeptide (TPR) repeat protein
MSFRVPRVLGAFLLFALLLFSFMSVDALGQDSDPASKQTSGHGNANANANSSRDSNSGSNSGEAAVFDRILNRIRFDNDGREVSETEAVIRIQSQAGVEEFGQLAFGYSSAIEKLVVEYVRVRKPDGQVVVTPDSTAQDFAPDVLREAPMYSDYRQRHISVAALQPGDTLEYRTVTTVITPLAPGNFWYEYTFPKGLAIVEDRLEIDIPKSREIKLKTPTRQPEIQDKGDRRIYTWAVKNVQPDRDKNREKDDTDEETGPDVQLTTFTSWAQVAEWYAELQGERMTIDESVRKKADELVKGADTPTEKARRLYDFVARNVRYVSISLGVGRYQPHAASEVLQNGYGDCKDKHTLFAAMLRAEGIQSYPVLINSSQPLDVDVPSPGQFDHVITAARIGSGLTWLDTTPEVTPYGLILYQLRNKEAVVASADREGGLQRTPADSPIKTFMHFTLDGKFSEFGALDATLDVTAQGDRDWPMRGAFRRYSQTQWKELVKSLSASWSLPGDVDDVQLDPIEDTSKPFHLKYHLHQDQYFVVPSTSVNFRPIPPLGLPPIRVSEKSTAPLDIGPEGEMDYRVRLQLPSNYAVRTPLAVKMSRDYGDYSSSYSQSNGILEGERKLIVKRNDLAAARRADYESFRNAAQSNQDQLLSCTILTPAGGKDVKTASKMEGSPAELQKAGVKALQSKDYRSAIDLLNRAVGADMSFAISGKPNPTEANSLRPSSPLPGSTLPTTTVPNLSPATSTASTTSAASTLSNSTLRDGWYDLGLAYAGANDHEAAIAAFRKQVEVDPNHKHANGDLAMELQQTGKNDDAIAAYRKQLETTPYDKTTLKNFGLLLAQVGRDGDARQELEAAVALPPDDPEIKMALAQVYARLGEKSQAQELMKGLTGSANADSGQDIFATALKNDIDPSQTENDAQQVLYDIGGQFDSGEFDRLGPSAFSSMKLVALSWSRIGWAKFQRGENLAAMQFLTSAWLLSQSGTVANRLGQVFEKQGQTEKASHMFALAVAAGGNTQEVQDSRVRLAELDRSAAEKEIAQAPVELVQARTVKLAILTSKLVSAHFNLVFDSSPRPERAEFVDGDESLRSAGEQLREKDFPVRFPDVSSVKIVRRGVLTCGGSDCSIELLPIEK